MSQTPAESDVLSGSPDDDVYADDNQEDIGEPLDEDGDGIPDDLEDDGEVSLDALLADVDLDNVRVWVEGDDEQGEL